MKLLAILVAVLALAVVAGMSGWLPWSRADDSPEWVGWLKKNSKDWIPALTMPAITVPKMPDISMPDFSRMSDGIMKEFDDFTKQVADSLPALQKMGYEISTFRVQWALPPKAKLRLRSKGATDANTIKAILENASKDGKILKNALLSSAASAKDIQSKMNLGTAVIDVDFAVPPKVRMSFLPDKEEVKDVSVNGLENLDLACGQALAANWF